MSGTSSRLRPSFMRSILIAAVVSLAAETAAARNGAGLLDIIRTPNDGIPAMVAPGGTFEAVTTEPAELALDDGVASHRLSVEWSDLPGRVRKAVCRVGDDVPLGMYALHARVGDRTDVNVRSVCVRSEFPERYTVAHLTDTHVGSERHARTSQEIFREMIRFVNTTGAAFVLITGDLTENGEPEQFRDFVDILNTCTLPTFVCPGNHDRKALNYENTFGPDAYRFWFGKDGYLAFDTKDFLVADDLGAQPADVQLLRRAIKPARWAIGFSHRYEADMGMRTQITLFIDDPLDWLIFGHWHRANTDREKSVPWGTTLGATRITVTPAAINGAMRLFEIGPAGIQPGEVQSVVTTR